MNGAHRPTISRVASRGTESLRRPIPREEKRTEYDVDRYFKNARRRGDEWDSASGHRARACATLRV